MKILRAIGTASLVATLVCSSAFGQSAETSGGDMQMTAASRQQLIHKLVKEVNNSYVFPDMGV